MNKYHRRSIRLNHYDYSQPGSYFITICTHDKSPLFGGITNGEMVLNDLGKMVEKCILDIPVHFPDVELDKWVIMPNHVHMIIVIYPNENDKPFIHELPLRDIKSRRKMLLPKIIGRFKMNCSKQINILQNTPGQSIWQRSYYEHIIRNENELNKIRRYIINNPPQWDYDEENRNGLPIDEKKAFWSKFLNEFE